jgi:hypothetical protein
MKQRRAPKQASPRLMANGIRTILGALFGTAGSLKEMELGELV